MDTQDEPRLDQNETSETDKIAGIVVQTRADVGTESEERIRDVLAQRLSDAGLSLSDADIDDLAHQVAHGESTRSD